MEVCTFFGHRDCPETIKPHLREVLVDLIVNKAESMGAETSQPCGDLHYLHLGRCGEVCGKGEKGEQDSDPCASLAIRCSSAWAIFTCSRKILS